MSVEEVSSAVLIGPHNITSFSHSTVKFSCTSDRPTDIYWKYAANAGDSTVVVFDRRGRNDKLFDDRFAKTVNGSTTYLTIHSVQTSDAGSYFCRDKTSSRYHYAQLTVIGMHKSRYFSIGCGKKVIPCRIFLNF